MIRFIISTTVKRRDINGNCYNYSVVTSTKTGATLEIDSGSGSDGGNIKAIVREAGIDWEEMHYSECVLPARRYEQVKRIVPSFFHEHEITSEMILDLEKETVQS